MAPFCDARQSLGEEAGKDKVGIKGSKIKINL
jgi:hypothetical protein